MKNRLFTPYKIRVTTIEARLARVFPELFTPYKIRVTTMIRVRMKNGYELFTPYKIRVTTICICRTASRTGCLLHTK